MSQTSIQPEISGPNLASGRWMVTIFNNDTTPFDDVILALIKATGCNLQEAEIEAWEAHTFGKAPVHFASQKDCQDAAQVISAIGVKTEVTPEWQD